MNARRAALVLGTILALVAVAVPAASEPEDSIIVNGADVIIDTAVSSDQGLADHLAVAGPRVAVQYSNHVQRLGLAVVPGPFQALLDQVAERVAAQYANVILREELVAVPGGLQAVLDLVSDRVVFQYANADHMYSLYYPRDLVNDTTPPEVSDIGVGRIGANGILTITWTTDEFADSAVLYGTSSGSYPHTAADPLYVKPHAVGLPGLTPGQTYYYRLRSRDLSDNTTTTPEYSFKARRFVSVYLPVVVRRQP